MLQIACSLFEDHVQVRFGSEVKAAQRAAWLGSSSIARVMIHSLPLPFGNTKGGTILHCIMVSENVTRSDTSLRPFEIHVFVIVA